MILLLASLSWATIEVEEPVTAGQEVAITVVNDLSQPRPGLTVRAIYRRDLATEQDMAVGLTDARGRVYWTPKRGGPVTLRAKSEEQLVQVGYAWPDATSYVLGIPAFILGFAMLGLGLWGGRRRSG